MLAVVLCLSTRDWSVARNAGVAELADARDLKSRGRNPVPVRPRSPAPYRGVEQLVARRAHNPEVVGSSPTPATKKSLEPQGFRDFSISAARYLAAGPIGTKIQRKKCTTGLNPLCIFSLSAWCLIKVSGGHSQSDSTIWAINCLICGEIHLFLRWKI